MNIFTNSGSVGDLVYLDVLGTSMLFVNSYELAQELFEKRGNVYSNRYQSTVYNDLYVFGYIISWTTHFVWFQSQIGLDIHTHALRRDMASLQSPFQSIFRISSSGKLSRIAAETRQVGTLSNWILRNSVHWTLRALLERLYQSPDNFRQHLRFILGAIIIEVCLRLPLIMSFTLPYNRRQRME